jgi:predicted RNA polymerase sigma factor
MTAARHRAVDLLRKALHARKEEELTREIQAQLKEAAPPEPGAALDDPVRDDLLRLVFIACHPILSTEARVALTLRLRLAEPIAEHVLKKHVAGKIQKTGTCNDPGRKSAIQTKALQVKAQDAV